MRKESESVKPANLLLIGLLALVTLFTANFEGYFREGFVSTISLTLWLTMLGGYVLAIWLAMSISTSRLVSLVLVIFLVEYVKEATGTELKLWEYHSPGGSPLFGVCLWILAGLATYTIATKVLIPLTRRGTFRLPRFLNPLIVMPVFLLIPLTLNEYWPRVQSGPEFDWYATTNLFWVFYGLLLLAGMISSLWIGTRTLAGIYISTIIVGLISEHVGAASGVWSFLPPENAKPPAFLIFGCWPLEILFQYIISAILAREPLDLPPPEDPKPDGHSETTAGSPDNLKADADDLSPHDALDAHMTHEERILRSFMLFSGILYYVAGSIFVLAPGLVFLSVDTIASFVPGMTGGLNMEKFWLSMSYSMMMTISLLCFIAYYDITKNKGYVVPVLVAKLATSTSSLCFFILGNKYLAYLLIFAVDGALFWITLDLYLQANRVFFEEHTAFLRERRTDIRETAPTTVASFSGDDKFHLLDRVLEETAFFDGLERRFENVREKEGKSRDSFSVVIKSNFMFAHSNKDVSTYTDPELVEALVDRIASRGFANIAIVESQSVLGNYYANRDVLSVARHVGYSTEKNYRIMDLTEEITPYDYGARLGRHYAGVTWRDADFRISFAKNKTHPFCYYSLALKNVYGALPVQNKLRAYHTKRSYDWPTIESLKHFPVHFGIIDAFWSADGEFGCICHPDPLLTKTIIGGENLIAVDWVGAKKMGLNTDDVHVGRFLHLAIEAFGKPDINWIGDKSEYESWRNVSTTMVYFLDLVENAYSFTNWGFAVLSACDKAFPFKIRNGFTLLLRWALSCIKRYFYRYDAL